MVSLAQQAFLPYGETTMRCCVAQGMGWGLAADGIVIPMRRLAFTPASA
jgi:hypothetical protein